MLQFGPRKLLFLSGNLFSVSCDLLHRRLGLSYAAELEEALLAFSDLVDDCKLINTVSGLLD